MFDTSQPIKVIKKDDEGHHLYTIKGSCYRRRKKIGNSYRKKKKVNT
jgi:hypothetical protein